MPVVTNYNAWGANHEWIERSMDHAALESAHPDGCLLLAGPPTYDQLDGQFMSKTLLIGHPMNFAYQPSVPWTPMKTLGSNNKFALRDSATYNVSFGRLMMAGRNIFRATQTTLVQAGFDITRLPNPPTLGTGPQWHNEDSDVGYMPVGLGFISVNKAGQIVTALWFERACRLNGGFSVAAGQSSIIENCGFWVPRVVGLDIRAANTTAQTALADMVLAATGIPLSDTIPDIETR